MVTSDSGGIIRNSLDQRRGRQRSAGKINLSNNLGENGADPRAGSAAVGGATLAFLAMRGDSVTADSQGADSSSLNVSAGSRRFLAALNKSCLGVFSGYLTSSFGLSKNNFPLMKLFSMSLTTFSEGAWSTEELSMLKVTC